MAKRTRFLTVLCFLSGLNAIYGIISGLFGAIAPPEVDQAFIDQLFEQVHQFEIPLEGLKGEMETYYLNLMLSLGNAGAANFLFFGIQLIGVFLMFRLNRVGFALYAAAQIGLAFVPAVFGGFSRFGTAVLIVTLIWNAIWVVMYATQLKHFPKRT
jgi:hypothetical protein